MFVVNGVGENTPKLNKEYLLNHSTDLDYVKIIKREKSSGFLQFKNVLKICIFMRFFKYSKIQLLLRYQTLRFGKHVFHTSHATFLSN